MKPLVLAIVVFLIYVALYNIFDATWGVAVPLVIGYFVGVIDGLLMED